jgi:hypothetical protein
MNGFCYARQPQLSFRGSVASFGTEQEFAEKASFPGDSRMARKMDLIETAAGLLSWSLRLRIMN